MCLSFINVDNSIYFILLPGFEESHVFLIARWLVDVVVLNSLPGVYVLSMTAVDAGCSLPEYLLKPEASSKKLALNQVISKNVYASDCPHIGQVVTDDIIPKTHSRRCLLLKSLGKGYVMTIYWKRWECYNRSAVR